VAPEILAVLEVELVLAALLRAGRGDETALARILENCGAELLVDEDPGAVLGYATRHRRLEAVVDHLLGLGDLRRLFGAERSRPAEHALLERPAVIEGQDVEGFGVAQAHERTSLRRR
jgi:hypothetical protein